MNIEILKEELTNDPLARGYSGMTDKQATDDLNTVDRTTNKAILSGTEVLNAIPKTVLLALSATDRQRVWDVVHMGDVNPFGIEADIFIDIFGAGSITIIALQALRLNNVSRGVELNIGHVKEGYVGRARA